MKLTKPMLLLVLTIPAFAQSAAAQSTDTATAHKAAATALLNSNNKGAAHLACPATNRESKLPGGTCRFSTAVARRSRSGLLDRR